MELGGLASVGQIGFDLRVVKMLQISYEETIRKVPTRISCQSSIIIFSTGLSSNVTLFDGQINALNANNANKIRLKVVLPLNHMNKDLCDCSCVDVPLEMMPYLLEMLQ